MTTMPVHPRASRALKLASVAQAIGALEALARLGQYDEGALFAGQSRRRAQRLLDNSRSPLGTMTGRVLRRLDSRAGAAVLHSLSIVAAASQLLHTRHQRRLHLASATLSLSIHFLSRLRNPYGRDGSDQMLALIYSYRVATGLVRNSEQSDDLFLRGLNAQLAVSYSAAGLAKAFSAEWSTGNAVGAVLKARAYSGAPGGRTVSKNVTLLRLITWATVVGEICFPVIYLCTPRQARIVLGAAKTFHLGTAYAMGLPRFLWAFTAAHESARYVVGARSKLR